MRFIEMHCKIPEGPAEKVGKPIVLAPYQEDFIYAVYDNEIHTCTAILSMARKNAKTATIAALVIVHIAGPEAIQNSRISSGARSKKQAGEVYNYASKMAALSPTLRDIIKPVPSSKKLIGLLMNVEYEALAAEGSTAHGGSPVVAILDEVGQVKGPNDDFFEAIITSQGAYDNPLLIVISTQAPTDAAMLSVMIDDAETSQDPSIVCHVYRAPDECELNDEKAWAAANPAMGLFRSKADVADKARKAERMPSSEGSFRVLFLNQRVNMNSPFVSPAVWKQGNKEPAEFTGPCYGGLDLSATTDLIPSVNLGRIVVSRLLKAKTQGLRIDFPLCGVDQGSPGSPRIKGANQAGDDIDMDGFTAGYVMREGYWFSIYTNSQHYLYNAAADATADGSGNITVPVVPWLRRPPADNDVVYVQQPMIEGLVVGDEQSWNYSLAHHLNIEFEIEEAE